MREIRTYSLSGGRWPARKRATSDPTPGKLSNKADLNAAETVEGRGRAKGNLSKRDKRGTQRPAGLHNALEWGRPHATARGGSPGSVRRGR